MVTATNQARNKGESIMEEGTLHPIYGLIFSLRHNFYFIFVFLIHIYIFAHLQIYAHTRSESHESREGRGYGRGKWDDDDDDDNHKQGWEIGLRAAGFAYRCI